MSTSFSPTPQKVNIELNDVTNKVFVASNEISYFPYQINICMKKIFLFLSLFCISYFSFAQHGSKLDTLMSAYAKLHKFNGSVLVAKNGVILLNKGYGYRNAENKVANNEQTIFQLGSVTKQFTSAVI